MCTPRRSIRKAIFAVLGLALFAVTVPAFADDDPPDRVARLSFLRGDVSFQPSGGDEWVQANLNRPLGTGDKLYTDHDSRVEMEVGAATLRLDAGSSFDILNLDDSAAQTELTEGVMNLHVRRVFEGQSYEVDTPTLALVITQPGDFRVDIAPDGSSTMITVFNGSGDVYGQNNASYSVRSGQSYRFHDAALQDYEVLDIPHGDDFDNWVQTRNGRYEHAVSRQYVSDEVIGYADLDDYGGWSDVPEYGHVWYPTQVAAGWAPYRSGNWAWVDPWGWTWVDNNPWGFAPFHYGRWAYVGSRWGWCPGRYDARPIYAPALVGFVGGNGWGIGVNVGPVGWFPLGPRDVYVPWYHSSHNYFTNVNVHNTTVINNTNITNIYNNYAAGRPINNANYAYRQNVAAVTAVSRATFVGARPVNAARVQVNANQLRNANVVSRVGITPERASFAGAGAQARARPAAAVQTRNVIARTAPPARPVPVASRIETIQRNKGQPLQQSELRRAAPAVAAGAAAVGAAAIAANRSQPQHVQVVGQNAPKPQPLPARAPGAGAAQAGNAQQRVQPATRGPATTPSATNPNARVQPPTRETTTPARGQAPDRTAPQTRETQTGNSNNLPSSRFAPHTGQTPRTTGDTPQRNATTTGNAASGNATHERTPAASSANAHVQPNQRTPVERTQSQTPSTNAERRTTTATHATPTERTAPTTTHTQPAEQTQRRTTADPQQRSSSSVQQQQQRTTTPAPPREYTPRTAPQQPRTEPQQRSAPPQQVQQQRSPPPPQQRTPPPQTQTQERHAPPPKEKDKDKDDDNGHRRQ